MQFKIKSVEVNLSFTFIALFLFLISINNSKIYCYTLVFAFLHELVHLFFIYIFKINIKKIELNIFGANILRDEKANSFIKEVIINLSAPLFNLLLALILLLFSENNEKIITIAAINLFLGFFNILPFFDLDGGNALKSVLEHFCSDEISNLILIFTSIVVTIFVTITCVFLTFNNIKNITVLLFSVYMISNLIFKIKSL